eukprot:71405-Rhodomonas_salina.1
MPHTLSQYQTSHSTIRYSSTSAKQHSTCSTAGAATCGTGLAYAAMAYAVLSSRGARDLLARKAGGSYGQVYSYAKLLPSYAKLLPYAPVQYCCAISYHVSLCPAPSPTLFAVT